MSLPKWKQYEYFCRDHLIKQGYIAWLWKDIPVSELIKAGIVSSLDTFRQIRKTISFDDSNPVVDTGIDILAYKDEKYTIIQCKCYENVPLNRNDLVGFFESMYINYNKCQGIVFYTSTLSKFIQFNIINNCYPTIKFEKLIMVPEYDIQIENNLTSECCEYQLKDYQVEAVEKLSNYFDKLNDNRLSGILSMPGGTGKTVVFSNYASNNYQHCIVLSPTRILTEQSLNKLQKFYPKDSCKLLIDSDGCREIDTICNMITNSLINNKSIIIGATYASCDIICHDIIKSLYSKKNCIVIIDEFHNLPSQNLINENNPLNICICNSIRILFVSATPKCYSIEENIELETYIKNKLIGPIVYNLSLSIAVNKGYICD